jgi:CubicO group peptidase (beta-lactamase class C family)
LFFSHLSVKLILLNLFFFVNRWLKSEGENNMRTKNNIPIHGFVAPGFELVKDEFVKNFTDRGELGAAFSVYINNEPVVDLWGGYRDRKTSAQWEKDTLVQVFSATKGFAALALSLAHSKGYINYDETVCTYWPEFAQNGKEKITVRSYLHIKLVYPLSMNLKLKI